MILHANPILGCALLSLLLSNSTHVFGAADEDAALSNPEFTKPIILHIDGDAFSQAQRLRSLNGVSNWNPASDLNSVGGPNDFSPCAEQATNGSPPGIKADVAGYNFDPKVIARWLSNNQFFQFETYNLRYPRAEATNASGNYGKGFKTSAVFVCPILNNSVAKYLSSSQAGNVHNGVDIAIGRRVLTKWTFRNRYDTPVPGKGNVKIFAGTFTYRIDAIVPIVSFSGEGTANAKMYLDPDTGHWSVDNWKKMDHQRITLLTSPLERTKAQQSAPAVGQGDCNVLLLNKNSTITSPFKGSCKDGLADGHGTYKYSYPQPDGSPTMVIVTGEFRSGKLNGNVNVTATGSYHSISEGEYRENRPWNSIDNATTPKGVRMAAEYREGVRVAWCSTAAPPNAPNCTDRLRELINK